MAVYEPSAAKTEVEVSNRTAKIRTLNDRFRRSFVGGRVVITSGIQALMKNDDHRLGVLADAVGGFHDFSFDNDPHKEHDFGSFIFDEEKVFWKIDYYDKAMEFGSDDPADPEKTTRVLTIMLASEY